MKKKLAVVILGALMFSSAILPQNNFFPTSVVCAEVKTIEADGYYIMGDGTEENQGVAKERAREDAKRAASEQACTFIESISEIKNGNLTRDEIRTFSATVLEIIDAPVKIESNGDSMVFHCHITAKVDTNNVMEKLQQDRQQLEEFLRQTKELSDKMEKLNAEMQALQEKYKTASQTERTKINIAVKRNEDNFTATKFNEKSNEQYFYNNSNPIIEAVQFNKKGNEEYFSGNYNKAIEYYNKSIKLNPQNGAIWANLGSCYQKLKNYQKAVECYNNAIELNPDSDYYRQLLKTVLKEMK